jgi:hypothetical protein
MLAMKRAMRVVAGALTLAVALSACGSDGIDLPVSGVDARFVAEVASYQQVVDEPSRFAVGLIGASGRWVSFGNAILTFTPPGGSAADPPDPAVAGFLPLPGSPDPEADPALTLASEGRGVYAVDAFAFPTAGTWLVEASVELDGETESATATFEVVEEPFVPVVGDPAIEVDHPVIGDNGAPGALDSRARDGEELPDPDLHEASIADALAAGRPSLILFATPVYCSSRFCGPITDMVADLASEYADRATFVHVEVWSDFEGRELNPAAEAWVATDDGRVLEPWLFLVDAEGMILESWDNIATRDEVAAALGALPAP